MVCCGFPAKPTNKLEGTPRAAHPPQSFVLQAQAFSQEPFCLPASNASFSAETGHAMSGYSFMPVERLRVKKCPPSETGQYAKIVGTAPQYLMTYARES